MNKNEFVKYYWKHYKFLEKQFLDTERYVAIEKDNYAVYSNEFLNLFVLICNEYDAITTEYCNSIKESKRQLNMLEKNKLLSENIQDFKDLSISTKYKYDNIKILPFSKFVTEKTYEWWQAYNLVKHKRSNIDSETKKPNYYKANLKNVLTALSALYIILNKFYIEKCTLDTVNPNFVLNSDVFNDFQQQVDL